MEILNPDEMKDQVRNLLSEFETEFSKKVDEPFLKLLQITNPLAFQPIPSLAIGQLSPECKVEEIKCKVEEIKRGSIFKFNPAENDSNDPPRYVFEASYDTLVAPFQVSMTTFSRDFLELSLECENLEDGVKWLKQNRIRFFIKGKFEDAFQMYSGLFFEARRNAKQRRTASIQVGDQSYDVGIRLLGFDPNQESVLPFLGHSNPAEQLLLEYFLFVEKFMFFELENVSDITVTENISSLTCRFKFDTDESERLKQAAKSLEFLTNCLPIANVSRSLGSEIVKGDDLKSKHEFLVNAGPENGYGARPLRVDRIYHLDRDGKQHQHVCDFRGRSLFNQHSNGDEFSWFSKWRMTEDRRIDWLVNCKRFPDELRDVKVIADLAWTNGKLDISVGNQLSGESVDLELVTPCTTYCEPFESREVSLDYRPRMAHEFVAIVDAICRNVNSNTEKIQDNDASQALRDFLTSYSLTDSVHAQFWDREIEEPDDKRLDFNQRQIESVSKFACDATGEKGAKQVILTLRRFPGGGFFLFADVLRRFFEWTQPIDTWRCFKVRLSTGAVGALSLDTRSIEFRLNTEVAEGNTIE